MGSRKKYNAQKDFGNATTVIPLIYPGIGDTGETITIRSRYSDAFREAQAKATRQIAALTMATKGTKIDDAAVKQIEDMQFAVLIADWTFDEPCTPEEIIEFLEENPQVYDLINTKAAQDSLFLKKNGKK